MDATETEVNSEVNEEVKEQKPEKYFEDQFDDETVIFVFRRHPVVMRKGLIFGLLFPVFGVIPAAIQPEIGFGWFFGGLGLGILAGLLFFTPWWIGWHFSVFIVTDQRFLQITQKGLFHRAVNDLSLHHLQSVNYEVNGLQETLLGFGTIKIQTYMGDLVIHYVHHPGQIQSQILAVLRDKGFLQQPHLMVSQPAEE